MKQTYSSTINDPIVANQRLKIKLDFVQRESIKRECYLKDIQKSLSLSNLTITKLTQSLTQPTLSLLHQQNLHLSIKLKQQFQSICRLNALYLLECQLRIEERKGFQDRIRQFQDNIQELRRYLHDKEDSFSFVVHKLNKYEQLTQRFLEHKLNHFQAYFNYDTITSLINQLTQDKNHYKNKLNQVQKQNTKLQAIISSIKKNLKPQQVNKIQTLMKSQGVMKNQVVMKLQSVRNNGFSNQSTSKTHSTMIQQKMQQVSTNINSTNTAYVIQKKSSIGLNPNAQIIRLYKKQKLSNTILTSSLTQAISKNQQLLQCYKKIQENNNSLRYQMDCVIADMVLLCNRLTNDNNYRLKQRVWRNKCDHNSISWKQLIKKYITNDQKQAYQIVFNRMRQDVDQIGQFIVFCDLNRTSNQSYQCPQFYSQQNIQDQQYNENQQFSINQI